jgi:hypothetical protein
VETSQLKVIEFEMEESQQEKEDPVLRFGVISCCSVINGDLARWDPLTQGLFQGLGDRQGEVVVV